MDSGRQVIRNLTIEIFKDLLKADDTNIAGSTAPENGKLDFHEDGKCFVLYIHNLYKSILVLYIFTTPLLFICFLFNTISTYFRFFVTTTCTNHLKNYTFTQTPSKIKNTYIIQCINWYPLNI